MLPRPMPSSRAVVIVPKVMIASVLAIGCRSEIQPTKVEFDPAEVAARVMEQCDLNKDGKLSKNEIDSSAALAKAAKSIDTDGDKVLSKEEIAARMAEYRSQPVSYSSIWVYKGEQPAEGATVRFTAEPFMGEGFPVFEGPCDPSGRAYASRPDGLMTNMLPPGLYTAEVQFQGKSSRHGVEVIGDLQTLRVIKIELP